MKNEIQPEVCRRKTDRRQSNQPFHFHSVMGRRRGDRRSENSAGAVIDHHPPVYLFITISILVLCFADAFNTLILLQDGGKELNPIMDILIRHDAQMFVMAKFALTGLGLLLLVGYRNSTFIRYLKAQHLLYGVFFMYTSLILYQSVLFPDYMFGLVLPM